MVMAAEDYLAQLWELEYQILLPALALPKSLPPQIRLPQSSPRIMLHQSLGTITTIKQNSGEGYHHV